MTAFRELVERHKKNIYYLALDLSGNHFDAEDLSQEVFIRALRSLKNFRGEAKFGSWLYRITVNCHIDQRRKNQMKISSLHSHSNEESNKQKDILLKDENGHNPEKRTEATEIQKHIQAALGKLTPREQSVFVLRHYRDLPIKEIARVLDVAEGTVKSLLFRALQRLQKELSFYRPDLGLGKE
ncbi:sigma-70 family RNA polymerase sigma factor [Candidatus Saccharibacteria bacterium]|nr:sigma-70 family RNA polymerase sigma factor [Calditrichia bacterium]NIV71587.1 sigma-70 family RNA polymerase sigma factor [Calditrichia bacterium]NIV98200.1 sigma-70 family RNA polymerase sigma factor [Candidatus Saccharibacteria bacterium]NIW78475.1 sigma-70 family RNA polymerase sigma factor [Calditrichia bacterium]